MYKFLQDYLLLQIELFMLKLLFKKLQLFCDEICALGLIYKIGGIMSTKPERADRICHFPVPTNQIMVQSFLGLVQMTRPYCKNFGEIARPLSRLTGDVEWQWGAFEQLALDFLKEKCSTIVESHSINPRFGV